MELILQKNEILDLGNKPLGLNITCLEGCFWLTQTGDNQDYILVDGQKFTNRRNGQLYGTALEKCRLTLIYAESKKRPPIMEWLNCHG